MKFQDVAHFDFTSHTAISDQLPSKGHPRASEQQTFL
jgi:hypothetical protein